jgi:bifunctional UDP-N-acetylglucosamine pyrophosphorylase/glucosamine-1-phosphate N-acetyltransferase
VTTALQEVPRGTGDAARAGLEHVQNERVLVLYGDTPLIRAEELRRVVAALEHEPGSELALMACEIDEPTGYGRVLRDPGGRVREVREERDLENDEQRSVREVNAGVYAARTAWLRNALRDLQPNNAQAELYLTDAVALAATRSAAVAMAGDPEALLGVNDRAQLNQAERLLFERIAHRHSLAGVTVRGDMPRIEDGVSIEPDAIVEANVCLRGNTRVRRGANIDAGCVVTDSEIGENAVLKPYSIVIGSSIGAWAQIGPFAHLRPGTQIDEKAHIGNFVETKNTRVRRGAKANHLAYLGDGDIGEGANVGAGTIFCNYDGFQKHKTVIGEGAFIGSDSQIVAPITIGKNAYVATGTTVTRDVPEDALAIARIKQDNKAGYAAKLRGRLHAAAKKRNE